MTEHKFTDEEVIKALRCLSGEEIFCKDCYFSSLADHGFACKKNVSKAVLDLINRQKAEIERLTKLLDDKCDRCIARDKAEAIKEFADRLKTYYRNLDKTAGGLVEYHIDQIAKEFLERGATDSQDNC